MEVPARQQEGGPAWERREKNMKAEEGSTKKKEEIRWG